MDLDFIRRDSWALQRHFKKKRDFLLRELAALGITVKWVPTATFYIWADLSALPNPINDCLVFLEECVRHKVICVPGKSLSTCAASMFLLSMLSFTFTSPTSSCIYQVSSSTSTPVIFATFARASVSTL